MSSKEIQMLVNIGINGGIYCIVCFLLKRGVYRIYREKKKKERKIAWHKITQTDVYIGKQQKKTFSVCFPI